MWTKVIIATAAETRMCSPDVILADLSGGVADPAHNTKPTHPKHEKRSKHQTLNH